MCFVNFNRFLKCTLYLFNVLVFLIYFQIMTETRTLILWPTRLKIGAKSKKGKSSNEVKK